MSDARMRERVEETAVISALRKKNPWHVIVENL